LGLAFFGLTLTTAPKIRLSIFKQIHEIVFHGKGGYDYYTIYNMPIWLRKFTFKQINDYYEEEAKAIKDSSSKGKKSLVGPDGKVNTPDFKKITKAITNKTSYK
jgi:hypothetical protein